MFLRPLLDKIHPIYSIVLSSGGFRGGGGTPSPCPPRLWNLFVHVAPPPFWNLKKKVSEHSNVSDSPPPPPPPPPPPVWDLRDSRRWWRSEKKVSESPPRSSAQLFLDLRDFRGWRGSEKTVCCAPPPFFKSWIRPWSYLIGHRIRTVCTQRLSSRV